MTDDEVSLSGDPLVGIARDWAQGKKTVDLCHELYIRLVQAYGCLNGIARKLNVSLDELNALGSEGVKDDRANP